MCLYMLGNANKHVSIYTHINAYIEMSIILVLNYSTGVSIRQRRNINHLGSSDLSRIKAQLARSDHQRYG